MVVSYCVASFFPTVLADCGTLPPPDNGLVIQPDTTEDGVTTFSCAVGFDLIGNAMRTCLSTATWSGMTPTCQSMYRKDHLTSIICERSL